MGTYTERCTAEFPGHRVLSVGLIEVLEPEPVLRERDPRTTADEDPQVIFVRHAIATVRLANTFDRREALLEPGPLAREHEQDRPSGLSGPPQPIVVVPADGSDAAPSTELLDRARLAIIAGEDGSVLSLFLRQA